MSSVPQPERTAGLPLRRRLLLALVAGGVLLLVLIVVAGVLLLQVRRDQSRIVSDYFQVLSTDNTLFIELVDSETAVRGFALTGEPTFLEPFHAAAQDRAAAARSYAAVAPLLGDDDEARAALRAEQGTGDRWARDWAQPTLAAVRSRGESAVDAGEINRGKALFDDFRTAHDHFRGLVVSRRDALQHELRVRTDTLIASLLVAGLVAAVLGALLWWALRRWVTGPLSELGAETRLVSEGHLEHRLQVAGPPEILDLAADVERMRVSLIGHLEEATNARREIEAGRIMLEQQAEDLQRSNQELEQFAYVASHDLQEPLRKVASFCQLLERRYAGQLDERADQYIGFAVDGAKRMQQLINDLLAFSRVGRLAGRRQQVSLEDCLRAALRNLEAAQEETGAEVGWDPLPTVEGEGPLLTQVFQNLIGNAMKFRGPAAPRIHIGVSSTDDGWEFSCSDNGIGIEPQYADRIFVIFQRLHAKEEYAGTGIGLAMCKKIIEYHGGRIWLDESAGPGTTFRWTLPAAVPAPPGGEPEDTVLPGERPIAPAGAGGATTGATTGVPTGVPTANVAAGGRPA